MILRKIDDIKSKDSPITMPEQQNSNNGYEYKNPEWYFLLKTHLDSPNHLNERWMSTLT